MGLSSIKLKEIRSMQAMDSCGAVELCSQVVVEKISMQIILNSVVHDLL